MADHELSDRVIEQGERVVAEDFHVRQDGSISNELTIKIPLRDEFSNRDEVVLRPRDANGVVLQVLQWKGGSDATVQDRIQRIRSGKSVASTPLRRTAHMVGNVILLGESDGLLGVKSSFNVHVYDDTGLVDHTYFRSDARQTLENTLLAWQPARSAVPV